MVLAGSLHVSAVGDAEWAGAGSGWFAMSNIPPISSTVRPADMALGQVEVRPEAKRPENPPDRVEISELATLLGKYSEKGCSGIRKGNDLFAPGLEKNASLYCT